MENEVTVPMVLLRCIEIFDQRNGVHKNVYLDRGPVMHDLIHPLPDISAVDWQRLSAFDNIVTKLMRYSRNFNDGGHEDSLDDLIVYVAMLQQIDANERSRKRRERMGLGDVKKERSDPPTSVEGDY